MSTQGRAQFTPGPWVVKSTDEDINTKTIIDSTEFWIAKVLNFNRVSDDIRESQANAHLIAAAPAMYEALKMARWLSNECECHESWNAPEGNLCGHCTADLAIKTALSQAEGK